MLELIALALLQLATFFTNPNAATTAPKPTNTLDTGGGSWGEGQATNTGGGSWGEGQTSATGGGSWGEGQVKKP